MTLFVPDGAAGQSAPKVQGFCVETWLPPPGVGRTVWSDVLPGGGQATPMTYEADGKQYLAIMAGGHHFMETPVSDQLVVYTLANP